MPQPISKEDLIKIQDNIALVRPYYDHWKKYAENQDYSESMFRNFDGILAIADSCYSALSRNGIITMLQDLPEETKKELKSEAGRMRPHGTPDNRMSICKLIVIFDYLAKQELANASNP